MSSHRSLPSRTAKGLTALAVATVAATAALPAAGASAAPLTCMTGVVLPTAQLGSVYQSHVTTSYTGFFRINMKATGLPAGLTMSTGGFISGTPTVAGSFKPTFRIGGLCGTETLPLTVKVDPQAHVVTWNTENDAPQASPATLPGLSDVTGIADQDKIGAFLKGNGTVWTWEDYDSGFADAQSPVQVPGLSGITQVSGTVPYTDGIKSDYDTAFALRYDGTVWAWGDNRVGQFGNGTTSLGSLTPQQVPGLSNVVAVAAAFGQVYALTEDGKVYGCGTNDSSELGSGPAVQVTPALVPGMTHITAIAMGFDEGYALRANGTVAQIGIYTGDVVTTVPGLTGVTAIDADGGQDGYALAGGKVFTWGENTGFGLGNDSSVAFVSQPVQAPGLTGVSAIGTDGSAGYAIMPSGATYTWGQSWTGIQPLPVLTSLTRVVAISGRAALVRPLIRLKPRPRV